MQSKKSTGESLPAMSAKNDTKNAKEKADQSNDIETKRVAVIGAGISGLAVASILADQGLEVRVFEAKPTLGGLVACSYEHGNLFHRVGGHVFNSKDPKVHHWFWSKFNQDEEFLKAKRKAAIFLDKSFIPYPIELSLASLPATHSSQILRELIDLCHSSSMQDAKEFDSFESFLLGNFGKTLCNLYFFNYNKKIWNRDLAQIPLDWLDGKLPMAKPEQIILDNIISSQDDMVHSTFYYPRRDGSQFIVDRLSYGLNIRHKEVTRIQATGARLQVNEDSNDLFDHVVFTGDVRMLVDILSNELTQGIGIDETLYRCVKRLDSNATTNLLCECDANDYSWIYLPDSDILFHRMIMTGNFSPHNNAPCIPDSRITCTVEYSGHCEMDKLISELDKLPFRPRPISYNYCEASYIIHTQETSLVTSRLQRLLEKASIYCCGRFAEWKYCNMDAAIASAMEVADKICYG